MNPKELVEKIKEICAESKKILKGNNNTDSHTISAGERFIYNGIEFVCLDVFDNKLLAITSEIVKNMRFSDTCEDGSNNWTKSKIRTWLNDEFIKRFNKDDLILQTSDLTADNGDKKYGTCYDYITLLSCEQYKKYKKLLPTYYGFIFTITPWQCDVGNANIVCDVIPSGALSSYVTSVSRGLAPVCLFNLDNLNFNLIVSSVA